MINNFVYVLLAVLSVNMFTVTLRFTSLNRIVINTPREIFESSLVPYEISETPYFDSDLLENNLKIYYDKQILKYCKSYTLSFYYLNKEDESLCINNECDSVEVRLDANMVLDMNYSRTICYSINEGFYGSN